MKSVIIGTAGHIDHGKTALVKALTGIDADRLEEEKRRGITIDIGFAHLELAAPNGEKLRLGFVDVPGHERFVRNMLAGVGGIDLVLLVIAADESIKPQTREHFDICRLLGVRSGIVVLTKSDLVDPETLEVVRMEVEAFLRGSFLERGPVVAISSLTGAGIDELKRTLAVAAAKTTAKDSSGLARLPNDRVFSMKGFGTVVTGTLISGEIAEEDELQAFPTGLPIRVRGVQVHGQSVDKAVAGERVALNVAGAGSEDLSRGMTLAAPDTYRLTSILDVSLTLLPSAKPLKAQARVHLHAYTSQTIAVVRPYENNLIAPGGTAFAQLQLAEPQLLLPGDRFIIRQFSPVTTIGGGIVLDASPLLQKPKAENLPFLETMAKGSPEAILLARVSRRKETGLGVAEAVGEMNLPLPRVRSLANQLQENGALLTCAPDLLISPTAFDQAGKRMLALAREFHQENPLSGGVGKEQLREKTNLRAEVFAGVLEALCRKKKLEIAGEQVREPGLGVVMKDEEAESKCIIEAAFSSAGLKVPALNEVLAGLKIDKIRAQKIVTLLLRDKVLIKLSNELVFHRAALEGLRQQLAFEKGKSPQMDVARFKDLTGVTRKYAIPLLEYLDREHVTKRVGDKRMIL